MFRSNDFVRRTLMVATILVTAVYLGYRGLYTLNLGGWYENAASIGLLAAEVYGSFLMLLYFFSVWKISEPDPVAPPEGLSVDVYIPTYNEDPELLRGTIAAALALDYPHETYVLDDGRRPEVRELCERMGAHYLDRPDNKHAKAGNLNHAMTKTDGEFIIIFDADHIAQRHFITRLLGYFQDEQLAFIQTPHAFYNFDNFQGTLDYSKGVYWEEGQLFYNVIQPGKNHWNAVSFCGSAAMFRRSALDDVGGVATETITEDMQTGIRLHGRGWKSLFVNERLVSGQAATDVTAFNTQRLRWGEGNLSIFAYDNPVTMRGLTVAQRLCYLGAMLSWTTGVQKLMLYASPIAMLLTGISPVREFTPLLGIITAIYLATVWTTVKVVSNGYGHLLGTELTHMACFWTQVKATYRALFKRKFARFIVTSKRGAQSNRLIGHVMPQILLIGVSAVALAIACSRWWVGASTDLVAILVGGALITFHAWFAWLVLCRALRSKDLRSSWRHPAALHIRYWYADSDNDFSGQGVTFDLNESGAGIFMFERPEDRRLRLEFSAGGRQATVEAEIRKCTPVLVDSLQPASKGRPEQKQAWRVGVKFLNLTEHTHATLWWMAATYAVARLYDRFKFTSGHAQPSSAYSAIEANFAGLAELNLPISLYETSGKRCWSTITERLGVDRAAVLLTQPLAENSMLRYELVTPAGKLMGMLRAKKAEPVAVAADPCVVQELALVQIGQQWRRRLGSMMAVADGDPLREAIEFSPDESKLPTLKAGSTIGASILAASILAIVLNGWWLSDEILVSRVLSQGSATPHQLAALEEVADRLSRRQLPNEMLTLRLREAFWRIDYRPGLAKVDKLIVEASFESFYGMLITANVLDGNRRYDEAGVLVDKLMRRQNRLTSESARRDLIATASRNYAHREQYERARSLLVELVKRYPQQSEHRRALLEVHVAKGDWQAARQLMHSQPTKASDWIAYASMLSAEGRFEQATDVYLQLCGEQGFDKRLVGEAAANAMAAHRFGVAAKLCKRMLQHSPAGTSERDQWQLMLAKASLWSGKPEAAIATLNQLMPRRDTEVLTLYLQVVASLQELPADSLAIVEGLFEKVDSDRSGTKVSRALADAMMRHGRAAEAAPLLKKLVERDPSSLETQLSLADALHELGDHSAAHQQYQRVLEHLTLLGSHAATEIKGSFEEANGMVNRNAL